MTVLFVFAALIAANIVYSIHDSRKAETAQAMRDFYRVEYKKTYVSNNQDVRVLNGWY